MYYFTGKPCKRGHIANRYISSRQCVECMKRTLYRETAAYKEKKKAYDAARLAANPQKYHAQSAKYRTENKERCKASLRAWYVVNSEKQKARSAKWRKENPGKQNALKALWAKRNPACGAAHTAKRRAAQLRATPAWANAFFIEEAYDLAQLRTKATDFKWHVDHIVPLLSKSVCGLHVENNLRVIPARHNQSKSNRHWPDMPEQGASA